MTTPIDPRVEPEVPTQPRTAQLPAATPQDILLAEMRGFRRDVTESLATQDATLEAVVREGQRANSRLTRIEERVDDFESRIGRTSSRVREDSAMDLSRDAKLASVITWQNGVDSKLAETATKKDLETATSAQTAAILAGFDVLRKSPIVKMIGTLVLGLLTGYAASKGYIGK